MMIGKVSKYVCCFVLILMLLVPVASIAAEEEKQSSEEQKIPTPSELGPWWLYSSLKYEPIYPKWLFHLQGNVAYTVLDGNVEADIITSGVALALRKNRFTSYVNYDLSKNKTTIVVGVPSTTKLEQHFLLARERFDLTKRLYAEAGFIRDQDSKVYVKARYTYMAGLGMTILDLPKHLLNASVYYGYSQTEFDNAGLAKMMLPPLDDLKDDGIAVMNYYSLLLSQRANATEQLEYIRLFDEDNSYRLVLKLAFNFALTQNIAIFNQYQIRQEEGPVYDLVKPFGGKKRDTQLTAGIAVNF
jgi:hypothetical protein